MSEVVFRLAVWFAVAQAAWRWVWVWAWLPAWFPASEPYAMEFDSVNWKIREPDPAVEARKAQAARAMDVWRGWL